MATGLFTLTGTYWITGWVVPPVDVDDPSPAKAGIVTIIPSRIIPLPTDFATAVGSVQARLNVIGQFTVILRYDDVTPVFYTVMLKLEDGSRQSVTFQADGTDMDMASLVQVFPDPPGAGALTARVTTLETDVTNLQARSNWNTVFGLGGSTILSTPNGYHEKGDLLIFSSATGVTMDVAENQRIHMGLGGWIGVVQAGAGAVTIRPWATDPVLMVVKGQALDTVGGVTQGRGSMVKITNVGDLAGGEGPGGYLLLEGDVA